MGYEIFMAWKYLVGRRRSGFISLITGISVLGVAVGVMALIVVLAVMSGFDRELKRKIVGMDPHVFVEQAGGIADGGKVVDTIRKLNLPEIATVARVVQGQAIIRSEANAIGIAVRGVDSENHELDELRKFIVSGEFDFSPVVQIGPEAQKGNETVPSVVIGRELARILNVQVGDPVYVISPFLKKGKGLKRFLKQAETTVFRVRGIFFVGMNDFDTQLALVGLPEAQAVYHLGGTVSGVSVRLHDVDRADELKQVLCDALGGNFFARSWIDLNRNFFSALKVEKTVMAILLFLIILVAAFNIVSTLVMVVMEKTKDIGILKALGATGWGIQRIFLLQGFAVGAFGVILGGLAGVLIALNVNPIARFVERTTGFALFPSDIYFFSEIPSEINFSDVLTIILAALIASVFAGLYPARKASALKPAEALRYE
ncbi:MAG TPA: lipoprotein-releasing ABC transporter permease subunit [Candidatus Omnitrophota bacterium]|nr:lipoprotein-releasing ABC transporter permease subunit [Candidatus Omnitrophota bacterium]